MKQLLFTLFLLVTLQCYSQRIEKYYDYNWKECEPNEARFYSIIEKTDSGWHRDDYFINLKKLQMDGTYEDKDCKIKNGIFYFYYSNGIPESYGRYLHDKREGLWLRYHYNGMISDSSFFVNGEIVGISIGWHSNGFISDSSVIEASGKGVYVSWFDNGNPSCAGRYSEGQNQDGRWKYYHKNGQISDIEIYKEGKLIDKEYFDEKGVTVDDTTTKEIEASFKGGNKAWQKYLTKNLNFPSQYKLVNADKVVVVVQFEISEEGNVENAFVDIPFDPEFDKIALEVINKSPQWIPALQNNRHVKFTVRQPVIFAQEN